MYKTFYNFSINNLIKIRLHLGHKDSQLNLQVTSYIYGTRHNVNIYNLDLLWKPYRYLFYNLVQIFFKRNSFFIVGTNKHLPMNLLLENLIQEYPLQLKKDYFFYISGYIDSKWIGGLFTNWKIFQEFLVYIKEPFQTLDKKYKYQKYFFHMKGLEFFFKRPIPDFLIFLDHDQEALFELKKFQIPIISLLDTNMNPKNFLYNFFGNNDCIENIEFFFEFLKETIKEGRLKEQQLFYNYFMFKLKKYFKKKNLNSKKKALSSKKKALSSKKKVLSSKKKALSLKKKVLNYEKKTLNYNKK